MHKPPFGLKTEVFPGRNITQLNTEVFLQKDKTIAAVLDFSLRQANLPSFQKLVWKEME